MARPIVIAHRGASGYRPEHTLAAYALAIDQGADFIEPDVVSTRDGVLVARHENEIGGTTDVASHPEFAARRTSKTVDGEAVHGWFVEDFTLEELRTLRARERLPAIRPANASYDGQFLVPTFAEIVALAVERRVGVYPETKHASYFASIGLPLEPGLVETLERHGLRSPTDAAFIQSFEAASLHQLAGMTRLRLVQLMARPVDDLGEVARYTGAIGPAKELVIPPTETGGLGTPSRLVDEAHAHGLLVHAWTFRAENAFLPTDLRRGGDAELGEWATELAAFLDAGVDGVFADQPDLAVSARESAAALDSR